MATPAQATGLTRICLFDCPARHGRPNQGNDASSASKWHLELAKPAGVSSWETDARVRDSRNCLVAPWELSWKVPGEAEWSSAAEQLHEE
jgi:hypothetical protein